MSISEAVVPDVSFAFGPFRLEPAAGRLLRGDDVVPLTPKVFDTLLLFVENAGRVLSREVITERIWPDTIVADTSLTQNIFLLRKALGEEYIETVPRRGYRFTAAVARVEPRPLLMLVEDEPPVVPAPARKRRWPFVAAAMAILLLAAAIYLVDRQQLRRRFAAAREVMSLRKQPSIVTAPFANERRNPADVWLRNALPRMIADELAAGERLRVAPSETAVRMPIDLQLPETTTFSKATAKRIGKYSSADLILCGSFVALGGPGDEDFELTARVQDVRSGEVIAVSSVIGSRARLFGLVQNAADDLRTQLGMTAPAPDEQRRALYAAAPANLEAARLYTSGIEELHRYDLIAARDLLLAAEKADPNYPLTQKALCDVWSKLAFNSNAKAAAARALALARDLPRAQQLEIEALHAQTHKELEKAVETREALLRFYPDNVEYALDLMAALYGAQKAPRAIEVGRQLRARGVAVDDPRVDFAEGNAHFALGDWKAAQRSVDAAIARLRDGGSRTLLARALSIKGSAMESADPKSEWRKPVEESMAISRSIGYTGGIIRALNTLAIGYSDDDQHAKALPLLQEAMRIAVRNGDVRGQVGSGGNLVYVANKAGDWEAARIGAERSLVAMRAAGDRLNEGIMLNLMAIRSLSIGDFAGGKTHAEASLAISRGLGRKSSIAVSNGLLARAALANGRLRDARAHLEEGLAIYAATADVRNAGSSRVSLARVAFEEGKLAEARQHLAKSENDDKALALARLEIEEGRPANALTALASRKAEAEVQALRALAQARLGNAGEAGRLAADALRLLKPTVPYHEATEARIEVALATAAHAPLEEIARDAAAKGDVLAAFDARLARCTLTRDGCDALAREAKARGFVRIARRARGSATIRGL